MPIARAPSDLQRFFVRKVRRASDATEHAREPDEPADAERARSFLRSTPPAVEGEGGDAHTYATAALVRERFGLSEPACAQLMLEEFNPRCEPPWSVEEMETKVANAYEYALRSAGSAGTGRAATRWELFEGAADGRTDAEDESAPAAKSRNPFRPLSEDEIERVPPPVWAVEGVLAEGAKAQIVGPWGSYKTFLALDLAYHLATGRDWHGHAVARPYRVVYVAGEGWRGVDARMRAWREHHGAEKSGNLYVATAMPLFYDHGQLELFVLACREFAPDFLVLDTAAQAMAGLDENAASDASRFVASLDAVRRDLGECGAILVSHTGKSEQKGARGSTAIPAAMDTQLSVNAPAERRLDVYLTKQRDGETWPRGRPLSLAGEVVGSSLAFERVPPRDLLTVDEQRDGGRAHAVDKILRENAQGPAMSTARLSEFMVEDLEPHVLDDEDKVASAASSYQRWLRRYAEGDGQRFLYHKGRGRDDPHEWHHSGDPILSCDT